MHNIRSTDEKRDDDEDGSQAITRRLQENETVKKLIALVDAESQEADRQDASATDPRKSFIGTIQKAYSPLTSSLYSSPNITAYLQQSYDTMMNKWATWVGGQGRTLNNQPRN